MFVICLSHDYQVTVSFKKKHTFNVAVAEMMSLSNVLKVYTHVYILLNIHYVTITGCI